MGPPVGTWFDERARSHGGFDVELVDLLELDLPFMDEPNHPRLRRYTKDHTRAWSARVDAADAFVFVIPEYNNGMPAPLKNAIDFLNAEWAYKPIGFVSYGGVSAGTRSAAMTKQVLMPLRAVPIRESVSIPFVAQFIDDEGELRANETKTRRRRDARRARRVAAARWLRSAPRRQLRATLGGRHQRRSSRPARAGRELECFARLSGASEW